MSWLNKQQTESFLVTQLAMIIKTIVAMLAQLFTFLFVGTYGGTIDCTVWQLNPMITAFQDVYSLIRSVMEEAAFCKFVRIRSWLVLYSWILGLTNTHCLSKILLLHWNEPNCKHVFLLMENLPPDLIFQCFAQGAVSSWKNIFLKIPELQHPHFHIIFSFSLHNASFPPVIPRY